MKKKGIILCLFAAFLCLLAGCNETKEHEVTIPSKGPEASMGTNNSDGYETIDDTYCGYEVHTVSYDSSWAEEAIPYEGGYDYLSMIAGFKNTHTSVPVKRNDCASITEDTLEGYAGAWCECETLQTEQYYYDVLKAFSALHAEEDVRIIKNGYKTDIGIKVKDTLLYQLLSETEEVLPIPDCYMHLPSQDIVKEQSFDMQVERKDEVEETITFDFTETKREYLIAITSVQERNGEHHYSRAFGYVLK